MKIKLFLLLPLFVSITYFCAAQPPEGNFQRAEALQIAFITKELALTTDEAQKFWPVYNNYQSEVKTARKDSKDDPLAFEEKLLNTRKKYKPEFKKILGSDDRVNKLFVSENNFKEMLRKELLRRRMKKQGVNQDE